MTTINSGNRLRRSADSARLAGSAERLSLLTEFIVVIDESSPSFGEPLHPMQYKCTMLESHLILSLSNHFDKSAFTNKLL